MPFEGNEEQVAQILRYEDIIGSAHAEGTPDLLDTPCWGQIFICPRFLGFLTTPSMPS